MFKRSAAILHVKREEIIYRKGPEINPGPFHLLDWEELASPLNHYSCVFNNIN